MNAYITKGRKISGKLILFEDLKKKIKSQKFLMKLFPSLPNSEGNNEDWSRNELNR